MTMRLEHQPPRERLLHAIALAVAAVGLLWLGALVAFVGEVPHGVSDPERQTDGIVVLTGGALRLDAGLELLAAGKAKRMFISGVNPSTGRTALRQIAGRQAALIDCCVDLGFAAANTWGNAIETAEWARGNGYRSLRVVTAAYHMPRSLIELHRRLPDAELVAYPVFPEQFKLDDWWAWPGTAYLLAEEFDKYLALLVGQRLDELSGGRIARWLDWAEQAT
jgi:uncharacterized SAM-binding protein YcdF (DUF218 family)